MAESDPKLSNKQAPVSPSQLDLIEAVSKARIFTDNLRNTLTKATEASPLALIGTLSRHFIKIEAGPETQCEKARAGECVPNPAKPELAGDTAPMATETESAQSSQASGADTDNSSGGDRRAAVDAFILKCQQKLSLKVKRKHIWRAAGHKTPRQFQFWQASDPKATAQDDQNFRRILDMNPTDFKDLLKKKGVI